MGGIPFVPGTYDYRPGERIADLIMRSGDVAAQRQARSGEIWGGAVNQLGQIASDAIKKHQEDEDQRQVGGAISAATAKQYPSATQPGPVGSGALIDPGSYQGPPGMTADMSGRVQDPGADHIQTILQSVDPKLRPSVMKGIQDFNAAQDVADERQARLLQMHQAAQQASADAAATLAHGILQHNFMTGPDGGLGSLIGAAAIAKQKGAPWASAWDTELQQAQSAMQQAQASGDPGAVKAVADTVSSHFGPRLQQLVMGASQTLQEQWRKDSTPIKLGEGDTLVSPTDFSTVAKGAPKPETRSIDVQAADALAKGDQESYKRLLRVKEDTAKSGAEGRISVSVNAPGGPGALTPDAVEFAGTQYRVTGKMPAMGMGNGAARAAIMNEAAKQAKALGQTPVAAIQRQAAYAGDTKALSKMQSMSAAAESFEQKATAQAQIVSDLSKKVSRTQFPLLNSAVLSGKAAFGDKDTQLLFNSIMTFSTEYAKIMEGSTGSAAGSSDSARQAAQRLISAKLNNDTLQATLALMQREMQLTISGYDATIGHITERMGGTPQTGGPAPAAGATTKAKYRYDPASGKLVAN